MARDDSATTPSTRFETASDPPFVGRSRETASLHETVAEALAGNTRIVAIAGEPGIGKTRLAHETATFASQHGFQVFWGRCNESGWAPPYWPWIQIIRSYITAGDSSTVRSLMGRRAMHIGEAVEEVRDLLPDLPHPDPVEPQVRRYLFFQAVTDFIERASRRQPLLIIIDDLHWADTSSLHLLEFLAQSIHDGRLLFLATYRNVSMSSSHPLTPTLGELARNRSFVQMSLEPFSADEVVAYVTAATRGAIPPETAIGLHGRTEGNPLYVSETTKLLALHELQPERLMEVPETVQLAIGQRLSHLTGSCRYIVATGAVIGEEFSLTQLSAVLDEEAEEPVRQALDAATSAGIVQEIAGSPNRYRFAHKMIQEVAEREFSGTMRADLHEMIGMMLEGQYGEDSAKHAAELARHFEQADSDAVGGKTAYYARLAGEAALAAYSFEEAAAHFSRAIAVKENMPMDDEKAKLLFGLGQAKLGLYMLDESLDNLDKAFDYFEKTGDAERMAALAGQPGLFFLTDRVERRIISWVVRAIEVTPDDSLLLPGLLSHCGFLSYKMNRDPNQAENVFRRALAISDRLQNPAAEIPIHCHWWTLDRIEGRHARAYRRAINIFELARTVDDKYYSVVGNLRAGQCAIYMGDGKASIKHREAALQAAEELRDRNLLQMALRGMSKSSYKKGELVRARELAARWWSIVNGNFRGHLVFMQFAWRIFFEYQSGQIREGDALFRKLIAIYEQSPTDLRRLFLLDFLPRFAYFKGTTEHADRAIGIIESSSLPMGRFGVDSTLPYGEDCVPPIAVGMIAVVKADKKMAAEALEPLGFYRDLSFHTEAIRDAGLIAQTAGECDFAFACFEKGLVHSRKAINYLEEAWCCHDWGNALIEQANTKDKGITKEQIRGNVEKARGLLEDGLQITQRLGMAPLQDRITSLLESLALQEKKPAYPAGLTKREVEVLREMAAGKTNQEISHALSISDNTVANHAKNIMAKIGVSNRVDAALYAVKQGLARDT